MWGFDIVVTERNEICCPFGSSYSLCLILLPASRVVHMDGLTRCRMYIKGIWGFAVSKYDKAKLAQRFPHVSFGHRIQFPDLSKLSIGIGSCISDDVWLSITACDASNESRIVIGHSVLIGRRSLVASAGQLEIGSYCLFAPNIYVSNAGHGFEEVCQQLASHGVV